MLDQRFRQRFDGVVVDVRKIRRGERPPALMMPDPDFLAVYEQPHVARLGPDRNLSSSGDQVLLPHGSPPVRIRIIDMQLRQRTRMLYVAAYGRGIFRRRI